MAQDAEEGRARQDASTSGSSSGGDSGSSDSDSGSDRGRRSSRRSHKKGKKSRRERKKSKKSKREKKERKEKERKKRKRTPSEVRRIFSALFLLLLLLLTPANCPPSANYSPTISSQPGSWAALRLSPGTQEPYQPTGNPFGKFGIIREADIAAKRGEFALWAAEQKGALLACGAGGLRPSALLPCPPGLARGKCHQSRWQLAADRSRAGACAGIFIDNLPQREEKDLFRDFMEDFNTGECPCIGWSLPCPYDLTQPHMHTSTSPRTRAPAAPASVSARVPDLRHGPAAADVSSLPS